METIVLCLLSSRLTGRREQQIGRNANSQHETVDISTHQKKCVPDSRQNWNDARGRYASRICSLRIGEKQICNRFQFIRHYSCEIPKSQPPICSKLPIIPHFTNPIAENLQVIAIYLQWWYNTCNARSWESRVGSHFHLVCRSCTQPTAYLSQKGLQKGFPSCASSTSVKAA